MDQHAAWKRAIAEELSILLDVPRLQAWKAVNAVFYSMKDALLRGEEVRVPGFGILRWHSVPPRRRYLTQHHGLTRLPQLNHVIYAPSKVILRNINQ